MKHLLRNMPQNSCTQSEVRIMQVPASGLPLALVPNERVGHIAATGHKSPQSIWLF